MNASQYVLVVCITHYYYLLLQTDYDRLDDKNYKLNCTIAVFMDMGFKYPISRQKHLQFMISIRCLTCVNHSMLEKYPLLSFMFIQFNLLTLSVLQPPSQMSRLPEGVGRQGLNTWILQ